MNNIRVLFVCSLMMLHLSCSIKSDIDSDKNANIIIEGQFATDEYKKLLFISLNNPETLGWMPLEQMELKPNWEVKEDRYNKGTGQKIHWALHSEEPIITESALLGSGILINPGDSIHITLDKNGYHYSGKGADALQVQHEIIRSQKKLQKPTKDPFILNSINDYFGWRKYLDSCETLSMNILDSYKAKISPFSYDWIKMHVIDRLEGQRAETFLNFINFRMKTNTSGLTQDDMVAICDSTLNGELAKWLRAKDNYNGNLTYFYQYIRIQVLKKSNFDFTKGSFDVKEKRNFLLYNEVKQNFTGQLRERLLQYIVARDVILKLGFDSPVTDSILKDYYNQPGSPKYRQWMHHYEDSMRLVFKK